MEIWKDIQGFEGLYQVSNHGRVKSLKRVLIRSNGRNQIINERFLSPRPSKKGYLRVALMFYQKRIDSKIHRLVAIHFLDNPSHYKEVNHKNGIKSDNRVQNLEWCSRSQNVQHAFDNGLKPAMKGELNGQSILTKEQVFSIRQESKTFTRKELMAKYNVSKSAIAFILQGKSWKHI